MYIVSKIKVHNFAGKYSIPYFLSESNSVSDSSILINEKLLLPWFN